MCPIFQDRHTMNEGTRVSFDQAAEDETQQVRGGCDFRTGRGNGPNSNRRSYPAESSRRKAGEGSIYLDGGDSAWPYDSPSCAMRRGSLAHRELPDFSSISSFKSLIRATSSVPLFSYTLKRSPGGLTYLYVQKSVLGMVIPIPGMQSRRTLSVSSSHSTRGCIFMYSQRQSSQTDMSHERSITED
ncbi:hypothetical protein SODALDRAFT_381858 [Sodiomyces alkalinus F11]|uniref:Uncharacterized protein n=1 Tax=Sodiomyces alkalinus (strain CBS 110278 / VKM F-3762 / F11) TaxID=1314773 RepID=A0A3N2PK46_SODAK|nr:hypothetical protein SODALDRAFT_381858 [Sodiomyces alkalinus F11]ROT34879.1 hypothetical protein SODALDRAFT_381858 [Sodiomyces alkalinus F11]